MAVSLPADVLQATFDHALEAFPAECCGFLTAQRGLHTVDAVHRCENAHAADAHPTAGDRTAETAYVIDGADLLALAESFDGPNPARVIYHSHPNGRAYFSETDRRVASSPWGEGPMWPVQQLVIGVLEGRGCEWALFAFSLQSGDFVEVGRGQGTSAG